MNRLTKKAQFVRNLITGKEIKYISNESDQMCVDKLGTLEDIEEELDIELFSHRLYKNVGGVYVSLDLYEYGKTWALTKEELENETIL